MDVYTIERGRGEGMLEIRKLNKKYSSGFAITDISLHINKGDFVLLLGEDDAGKTSLIYQVMGLHHFYKGQILFEGKPIQKLSSKVKRQIRFVPDSICMEYVTARSYFATLKKVYPNYEEEDVVDMCDYFGVNIDELLTEMTYNENKLVTIIGAIVTMPKLLILDEPLNFLTHESGRKLLTFLKYLSYRGVSILITADESKEIFPYCNRYVYMREGSLISEGTASDYFGVYKAITVNNTEAAKVQEMLGDPIGNRNNKITFLYNKKKQTKSLMDILELLKVSDIEIENLTLEEILEQNYTRWM